MIRLQKLARPAIGGVPAGTPFLVENIVSIYQFDEQLRELAFRYLLHIERHIRSVLPYTFCSQFGENQSAYLCMQNFDVSSPRKAAAVKMLIQKYLNPLTAKPIKYDYIEHHKQKHQNVPLWALVNALTFGTLSKIYALSKPQIQSAVSREFEGINENHLRQFLEVLTDFRNVCAHNERLFTHRYPRHDIPDLPLHRKLAFPQNGDEYIYRKRDYFAVLLVFLYLLPHTEFLEYKKHLSKLLDKAVKGNQQTPLPNMLKMMGFPPNWKDVTAYKKIQSVTYELCSVSEPLYSPKSSTAKNRS